MILKVTIILPFSMIMYLSEKQNPNFEYNHNEISMKATAHALEDPPNSAQTPRDLHPTFTSWRCGE